MGWDSRLMTSESPAKTEVLWLHECKGGEAGILSTGERAGAKVQAERKQANEIRGAAAAGGAWEPS